MKRIREIQVPDCNLVTPSGHITNSPSLSTRVQGPSVLHFPPVKSIFHK